MNVNSNLKKIPFFKMMGLSNDFIFIDQKYAFDLRNYTQTICDRKLGIGCDQLIMYSEHIENKSISLYIINNDGSFAEACGNAFRCAGDYFCSKNSWDQLKIITSKKEYFIDYKNNTSYVNMGQALVKPIEINDINLKSYMTPFYVNVGNPHVVLFTNETINKEDVIELGSLIENHKNFPKKTNVNFVHVIDKQNIKIQTWERGIGYSLSCGTGATASFAASSLLGLVDSTASVKTCGGVINCSIENKNIIISGKTLYVFEGVYSLSLLK